MPRTAQKNYATPLHEEFAEQLLRLFADRDVTIKDGMRKAGKPHQTWNRWQSGSSPMLETIEQIVTANGGRLTLRVWLPNEKVQPDGGISVASKEARKIAAWIDGLPEEERLEVLGIVERFVTYSRGSSSVNPREPGAAGGPSRVPGSK